MFFKKEILVTGAGGQLGTTLQHKIKNPSIFDFKNKTSLDISDIKQVRQAFESNKYKYCLNFGAYTNVEKAEDEPEKAILINEKAVENLAKVCDENNCILIHISTDYVFDGTKNLPYTENDNTNPLNVYGLSKLKGEIAIQNTIKKYFIIRTSWLYSEFKANFYKTILRIATTNPELKVINDQYGTPTYAGDLIDFILFLIDNNKQDFGLYHFSNEGETTWYEFAVNILKKHHLNNKILPVTSKTFPTKAARPKYSVLDKSKIKNTFDYIIPDWKTSLNSIKNQ